MPDFVLRRDGEINAFNLGAKIRMIKDILVEKTGDADNAMFIKKDTCGIIVEVDPVVIMFDPDVATSAYRTVGLEEGILVTDMAELIDGVHLRIIE